MTVPGRVGDSNGSDVSTLVELSPGDKQSISILVIDDERTLRESCRTFLESEGYSVEVCGRGDEALALLGRRPFDIVLIDLYMGDVPGLELLRTCLQASAETVAIIMTGNPSVQSSIEALRAGAWDYLTKPFNATQLQILVGRAAHAVLVARETSELNQATAREHGHSDQTVVLGSAPPFQRAIELARKVARTDASVFINGESGTGKELFAQFIHNHSRRSSRTLVAINCAALPEALLESEMFGHRKGAFTGAVRDKAGLLEASNGGTMFLDEVTEMSTPIQAKLLRVIQDGVVRRVGSETVDAIVNVRFIAATNRDPEEATDEGLLREDLYYRLRVVPITIPSLRERQDDIPILADYFLRHYWGRHRDAGQAIPRLGQSALDALRAHRWKGNVRELQGGVIRSDDLPFIVESGSAVGSGARITPQFSVADGPYHEAREQVIAEFERAYLISVVDRADGNMSKAARMAGVDRTTLYRLMQKHGFERGNGVVEESA